MDTSRLKKFSQSARQDLIEQVSSKLAFALKVESSARRENPYAVNELEKALSAQGKEALIDQVAYTWFNRFCALRFMDVNGHTRVGVVSPADGQLQPEILAEAKSGVIDDMQFNQTLTNQIRGLLNGTISSPDAQGEAYRLLVVGSCNALYDRMPYLFEPIQDFTELLMPDDLLSENSILANMRAIMTPECCQDVEVIGWLYQFYISEKKDEVETLKKKGQKVTTENIPAATQLFTPHWIVRYLVENSVGRLWMLNRPDSKLIDQMQYYIAPETPEEDFLRVASPEEIKIADPAVGSGHMLTYTFDLMYSIYEEEGYEPNDIPGLIIKNNLYGIEIDERAGALASFAIEMKAARKLGRRRFFRMKVKPNICVLEDVTFTDSEMTDVFSIVGKDLYTADLRETLTQFEQAKNLGSLIVPKLKDPAETARFIEAKDFVGDLLLSELHKRLIKLLSMVEYLLSKYHVVLANPPYLGAKHMNGNLGVFAKDQYPDSKGDLFTMFMERTLSLSVNYGMVAMINMQSWMFLSSYENLRSKLLTHSTILTMAHLGERAFDTIAGAVVSTTAFVIQNAQYLAFQGKYSRLVDGNSEAEKSALMQEAIENKNCGWLYSASAEDFANISGSPIAYWLSNNMLNALASKSKLSDLSNTRVGMATGDNDRFVRLWHEVSVSGVGFDYSRDLAKHSGLKWFPYANGGETRKWYGNHYDIVNWENDGFILQTEKHESGRVRAHNFNLNCIFKKGVTWSLINSNYFGARALKKGFLFSSGAPAVFANGDDIFVVLGLINSNVATAMRKAINPTVNNNSGDIDKLPLPSDHNSMNHIQLNTVTLIDLAKENWDEYEISWDFTTSPLLQYDRKTLTLKATYAKLEKNWQIMISKMQYLEERNNNVFIKAYGLKDELTPEVPLNEITLACNPAYRYGMKVKEEECEVRLKADTIAEFLSYAVGCMFGRYSLDESGLILANQGETLADYLARIPKPTFMPDDDNVIPLIDLEGDWFEDDLSQRFKQFLRVTFGQEHYRENLAFVEDALGKSIQKYFIKDFYQDHIKRYKKRPIYWLFSSSKGTFNALIYMHRYNASTVSVVLNDYLREFRVKLEARKSSAEQISISGSASQKEKADALKMIMKLDKAIDEVNHYEREVLYPLATQNITIDLDDGVKQNYPLFGSALKKIAGLS